MSLRDIITKAQQEKKRAKTRDTAKKVGIGIGIGAALGSALGVLLAPKAGKETRADIARSTKKTVENIKDGAGEVGTKIQQVVTEVMIAPRSRVIGSTLANLDRRWQHNATVLAIHRRGQILREQLKNVHLNVGDVLLMLTPESEMAPLRNDHNVIVLSQRESEREAG